MKYLLLPEMYLPDPSRIYSHCLSFSGKIRATVMVETLPAAFEMEEMLYELRNYACGMNAGRWDYIFSAIKVLKTRDDCIMPDRKQVSDKYWQVCAGPKGWPPLQGCTARTGDGKCSVKCTGIWTIWDNALQNVLFFRIFFLV